MVEEDDWYRKLPDFYYRVIFKIIFKWDTNRIGGGRAISISLFPLSFKEFLDFKNVKNTDTEKIEELIKEYIEFGAFPEIVLSEKGKKFFIIEDYYNTFLTRDITERSFQYFNSDFTEFYIFFYF